MLTRVVSSLPRCVGPEDEVTRLSREAVHFVRFVPLVTDMVNDQTPLHAARSSKRLYVTSRVLS